MKHILIAAIFCLLSGSGFAQEVELTGKVTDTTGVGLEMANVVALSKADNKMESYGISNAQGQYRLKLKANSSYVVRISYLGLESKALDITTTDTDLVKDVMLRESTNQLGEVEVTYEMPVTVKGDTIVYNADSFTNGSEKKLGDVLKNLPGVEVNEDGQIQVEGKTVQKVMVEGKDFFDGDSKIAVENIPSNALDKIEILRNFNEVSQMRSVSNNEDNVAINIRLKQGKKNFWFGELTGGAGPDERYLLHPRLFYYSPEYSINIITDLNNIGEMPFTPRDYFNFTGGFRNINSRGGTSVSTSSNSLGISTLQNNRARAIDTKFGAINFSYSPSKTWDISGFGIYSYTATDTETDASRTFIESNDTELTETKSSQNSKLALAKLSSVYKPNANLQFDYDLLFKGSDQKERVNVFSLSDVASNITENKKQKPVSVTQNANLYYTINEKNVLAVEAQHLYQEEDPFYNFFRDFTQPFTSIVPIEGDSDYDVSQDQFVKTNKADLKIDHYYVNGPKSHLNFTLGTIQSHQNFNSFMFQILQDGSRTDFTETDLNNDVSYHFSDLYLSFHLKFVTGIFTFNPGVSAHAYSLTNTQLDSKVKDELYNIVPDIYINVQLKKSENIRFNYAVTRAFTDINNLAYGYIFNNYNSMFRGNRDLESALFHNVSLNYRNFNMFNFTNITGRLSYNRRIDAFKSDRFIQGINQVNTTINSNFVDESLTGNGSFERTFGKIKTGLGANMSYSKANNLVNGGQRTSESFTQTYRGSLSTNFRKAPNLEIGYNYTLNDYDNAGVSTKYYTDRPYAELNASFLKGFVFNADFSYYHYRDKARTINNEYGFGNTTLTYQKPDTKWEYGLKVTNITNNKTINSDSFNELFFRTSAYVVQPRYLILSLKYDL